MWKTHTSAPAGADSITPGSSAERVAAADVDRPVLARDRQRGLQTLVPRGLVGPQAGAQPAHVGLVAQVDGREVDARAPRHRRRLERRHDAAPSSSHAIRSGESGSPAARPP